jgi:flagellar protein FliO/FliZ
MELSEILRFAAALVFVIGLIVACAWAAKRFGLVPSGRQTSMNKRLAVTETLTIDPKRKLVIVRHDDREHVLLLGDQDVVLEAGLPAREDLSTEVPPAAKSMNTSALTGPVADQMQKVVSLLKERRA